MKRNILSIGMILLAGLASGNPVCPAEARRSVETFWQQSNCEIRSGVAASTLDDITSQTEFSHLYIFSNSGGFVIMSGDDCAKPILAYSTSGGFDPENIPAAVRDWLSTYETRIEQAVNQQLEATSEIAGQWELLRSGRWTDARKTETVGPLVTAKWGQSSPYNAQCPPNTLVGCIAVAMGQVMHYWQYPEHGTGSHSYTSNGYSHNVDFSGATYDYSAMPNSCSGSNDAVATLLYHCGVAIETGYTSNNSTAYVLNTASHPYNAEMAMKEFFGYSSEVHGERRVMYNKPTWISMLKENLDAGIPIIYNGFNSSNSGGHCFICDGYDANDFFHFNWGQRGSYDGFFEIDDMTPSNQNFSYDQGAILGLVPAVETPPAPVEGIADAKAAMPKLLVYPNPTTGRFVVECGNVEVGECSFRVYDECGKLLVSEKMTDGGTIDLSARPDGIYFLQMIKGGKVVLYEKIVKVR